MLYKKNVHERLVAAIIFLMQKCTENNLDFTSHANKIARHLLWTLCSSIQLDTFLAYLQQDLINFYAYFQENLNNTSIVEVDKTLQETTSSAWPYTLPPLILVHNIKEDFSIKEQDTSYIKTQKNYLLHQIEQHVAQFTDDKPEDILYLLINQCLWFGFVLEDEKFIAQSFIKIISLNFISRGYVILLTHQLYQSQLQHMPYYLFVSKLVDLIKKVFAHDLDEQVNLILSIPSDDKPELTFLVTKIIETATNINGTYINTTFVKYGIDYLLKSPQALASRFIKKMNIILVKIINQEFTPNDIQAVTNYLDFCIIFNIDIFSNNELSPLLQLDFEKIFKALAKEDLSIILNKFKLALTVTIKLHTRIYPQNTYLTMLQYNQLKSSKNLDLIAILIIHEQHQLAHATLLALNIDYAKFIVVALPTIAQYYPQFTPNFFNFCTNWQAIKNLNATNLPNFIEELTPEIVCSLNKLFSIDNKLALDFYINIINFLAALTKDNTPDTLQDTLNQPYFYELNINNLNYQLICWNLLNLAIIYNSSSFFKYQQQSIFNIPLHLIPDILSKIFITPSSMANNSLLVHTNFMLFNLTLYIETANSLNTSTQNQAKSLAGLFEIYLNEYLQIAHNYADFINVFFTNIISKLLTEKMYNLLDFTLSQFDIYLSKNTEQANTALIQMNLLMINLPLEDELVGILKKYTQKARIHADTSLHVKTSTTSPKKRCD